MLSYALDIKQIPSMFIFRIITKLFFKKERKRKQPKAIKSGHSK